MEEKSGLKSEIEGTAEERKPRVKALHLRTRCNSWVVGSIFQMYLHILYISHIVQVLLFCITLHDPHSINTVVSAPSAT